ncbi:MAG: hypothetical protein U0031_04525 [Thermomicrobiales bacterium]
MDSESAVPSTNPDKTRTSRRSIVATIAAVLTALGLSGPTPLSAKKKKKKKTKPPTCPSGQTRCGEKCVDTANDATNCGGCGKQCATGQACQGGTCPGGACDVRVSTTAQLLDAVSTAETKDHYTICLDAGEYALPAPTISVSDLELPGGVALLGAGAGLTTLKGSGSGFSSVIGNLFTANLAWLTITGGRNDEGSGGGIVTTGELSVVDCVISGNTAGYGGGIFNGPRAELTLQDCTITDNVAHTETTKGRGGGVLNGGSLDRRNTGISGNTADIGDNCFDDEGATGC